MPLELHELHRSLNARFVEWNGQEAVAHYGDPLREHAALRESAGVVDLSFRSRFCLLGADRVRFLHGQVTNDVKRLKVGEGCYAAITTAKGRMQSDLFIYALQDELLLDFEPGLTQTVSGRLEKFIVSDEVQIVDVAPHYGLLSVQGPKAINAVEALELFPFFSGAPLHIAHASDPMLGELYIATHARLRNGGFDLFVPTKSLGAVADKLIAAATKVGGAAVGMEAFEIARIEAGVPRFGIDMDESNLPLECGIEASAISYNKGCYIGQEVINRVHSIGHVNRELRGLAVTSELKSIPNRGTKLFQNDREVGFITSAARSPDAGTVIALGYVRRECNQPGTELQLPTESGTASVRVCALK